MGVDFPPAALDRLRTARLGTSGLRPMEGPYGPQLGHLRGGWAPELGIPHTAGTSRGGGSRPEDVPVVWLSRPVGATVVHVAAMPVSAASSIIGHLRATGEGPVTLHTMRPGKRETRSSPLARQVDVFLLSDEGTDSHRRSRRIH